MKTKPNEAFLEASMLPSASVGVSVHHEGSTYSKSFHTLVDVAKAIHALNLGIDTIYIEKRGIDISLLDTLEKHGFTIKDVERQICLNYILDTER